MEPMTTCIGNSTSGDATYCNCSVSTTLLLIVVLPITNSLDAAVKGLGLSNMLCHSEQREESSLPSSALCEK